jgi:hypothetical protein
LRAPCNEAPADLRWIGSRRSDGTRLARSSAAIAAGIRLLQFSTDSIPAAETVGRHDSRGATPTHEMQTMLASFRIRSLRWIAFALALAAATGNAREISVEQAVQRVQQETDGKVLAVQTLTIGQRKIYRIKVLTPDGRMRVMQVPAEE